MAAAAASSPNAGPGASAQEYTIRVPKTNNKKFHVMKFASDRDIDFRKWNNVKMERENNMKEFKGIDEEQPKFGAGSEFGREQREEARRKKFGIVTRRYKPDDQPWLLKVGGKTGKKFKGIRDGGVGENASYYVFTHAQDGAIDAYPLLEWYNFQPIQRFKALSAEEAEEAYGKRNKTMNFFSLMLRKRLRPDAEEDGEEGEEGKKGKKGSAKKDLTISELDEWMNSSDDSDGSDKEDGEKDSDEEKKKKAKKGAEKKKKKKKGSDDEAVEESDDGDDEGREHEYISDSSSSESEHEETKQLKGVAEEAALRRLLSSGEDSDESGEKSNAEDKEESAAEEEKPNKKKAKKKAAPAAKDKKKAKRKDDMGSLIAGSSSELSSDSSDGETKDTKPAGKVKKEPTAGSSRSGTPVPAVKTEGAEKRKAETSASSPPAKKARAEGSGEGGAMEEAVRRYLARKPMTTTELLQKFKSKKTGMSSEQLVNVMTQILKKINPVKQTIKGKMYLSIKS